eukprot:984433-Prorocentrum_minimum.AAC.3
MSISGPEPSTYGPTRHMYHGYILMMDKSDAESASIYLLRGDLVALEDDVDLGPGAQHVRGREAAGGGGERLVDY